MSKWDFLFGGEQPNLQGQREQGNQAKTLWDNGAFQRAIRAVREGIHERWAAAPLADVEGQRNLRFMLKILDDVEGNIRKEMNDGTMAAKIIEDEQKKQGRAQTIPLRR